MTLGELPEIMAAIVALQEEIETPFDEPALADAVNGPPPSGHGYPCFFNEESVDNQMDIDRGMGLRELRLSIHMHLLFGAMEEEYSLESRRRWVQPVLDKFDSNIMLKDTVTAAEITAVRWAPIELNETPYISATFVLAVELKHGYEFE